jgi:phosphoribosylaminoimidazole (AIR) synthetase
MLAYEVMLAYEACGQLEIRFWSKGGGSGIGGGLAEAFHRSGIGIVAGETRAVFEQMNS